MAGRIIMRPASPGGSSPLLRRLRSDCRGSAITEFALVAPVFLMLVLGVFDVGQMLYGKVLLNGAVQQAARSSTLEGADTEKADAMVHKIVSPILPGGGNHLEAGELLRLRRCRPCRALERRQRQRDLRRG